MRVAHPGRQRRAGHARRRRLQHHIADGKPVADRDIAILQPGDDEIFAKTAGRQVAAQFRPPPVKGAFAFDQDRLVGSAVMLLVADLVADEAEAVDHGRAADGALVDAGAIGFAGQLLRGADADGDDFHAASLIQIISSRSNMG